VAAKVARRRSATAAFPTIGDGLYERAVKLPALPEERDVEMDIGDPLE
jgi:hypothetical protein